MTTLRDLVLGPPPSADGLTDTEADGLRREVGPNLLQVARPKPLIFQFLLRFRNPLVLLLLAASAISASTGDVASFVITACVVLLSVTLDFVQEHRAGQAAERLRSAVAHQVTVRRGGQEREVDAASLVPGDVVLLSAGALVPADVRMVDGRDCFVNQALLTGEAYPVEKAPNPAPTSAEPALATHLLFMGTTVVSGAATAVVVRTGPRTALGAVGQALTVTPPPTSFEQGTRQFGLLILRLAMIMVSFVLVATLARHLPVLQALLFAVALAVGLTPELLPMVVSVTLSRGALRMAEQRVIVKRLAAIHDLGSMDVLCTDKTGTLTDAKIRLEKHLNPQGVETARVLELAYVNSRLESGLRSPMDDAILAHTEVDITPWTKVDEVPFDFSRRRVSVLAQHHDGARLLVVKGALEDVLALCGTWEGDGPDDVRPLGPVERAAMLGRFADLGREGFRVLGVACKHVAKDVTHARIDDESALTFAGFAAFEDPPKASAAAALQALKARGVAVKVVSGDSPEVTVHVCTQLGLEVTGQLTGTELDLLDQDALHQRVDTTTIFCRVNPMQKQRVVEALRARGHVVGYLGDGINDAPPLHAADVGISVDTAVDVAKEAADLILLDQDLNVLLAGITEGRRTFANILKYVMMATSSNFGNMFSMAAASVILPFLPMLPVQVLVNNFLYDVSEIPIPMDLVDDEWQSRPRRWDMAFIRRFMITLGPVSSVFDLATFGLLWHTFGANERAFHTGWFVESLATQVLVIFVIRTRLLPWKSRPARGLVYAALTVVGVAVVLPSTPLGAVLGFVPLPLPFWAALAGLVAAYLVVAQGVKAWFWKHTLV